MTLAFDTHPQFQFFAMPKTVCAWMIGLFRKMGLNGPRLVTGDLHCMAQACRNQFAGWRSFTILRDPANWLASVYAYCTRGDDWIGLPGPAGVITAKRQESWEDFWDHVCGMPGVVEYIYRAYSDPADVVLRTESLKGDTLNLFESFGWDRNQIAGLVRTYPASNVSANRPEFHGDMIARLLKSQCGAVDLVDDLWRIKEPARQSSLTGSN